MSQHSNRIDLPIFEAGEVDVPYVIDGFDEQLEVDTEWSVHSHPTHELLWTITGASTVQVGRRTWTATPSSGVWIPAGMRHSAAAPAGTWYRTAHFGFGMVTPLAETAVGVTITPLLRLLLERLRDRELAPSARDSTEAVVLDVLERSEWEIVVTEPEHPMVVPIVEAVRIDPGDARGLADWAGELGVSTRTLTRVFRAETGQGFARWVASMRAQRAVVLLARGDDVDDVAAATGYASASAFGAAFRRTTGSTPGRFRPVTRMSVPR